MKSSIRNILSKAPFRGLGVKSPSGDLGVKAPFRGLGVIAPFRGLGVVSLLLLLHVLPAVAERPKLVVGILVDGLRQEHLDAFHDYFVEGGLKTLMHGGTALPHMRYSTASAGNAPDVATVMTGATPAYHGVAGNVYFNRHKGHEESVLLDADQVGIGTQHSYSAHRLLSTTVVDELTLATGGQARCYAVGIDPEATIMLGGHTARSATWIDDVQLQWVTTGYYAEGLPACADLMNVDGRFDSTAYVRWTPLFPVNSYVWNARRDARAFDYVPAQPLGNQTSPSILRRTPAANTLVTDLALQLLRGEGLGQGYYPDMLLLQYTVRTPGDPFASVHSIEKEDMYMRLDKEVKRLLEAVAWEAGMERTVIVLFANQSDTHTPVELGNSKIPSGYFNAGRAVALLNTYLMALYGQERWVEGYSGKHIFLNRRKIEEKRLDLREMQEVTAEFMLEFEGIRSAYTAPQIRNQPLSGDFEAMALRNSYHKDSGGDVVVTLLPGWMEVDNHNQPVGGTASTAVEVPVFFYGGNVPRQTVGTPYDMTDLAPTLTALLGIPTPNACTGQPIKEAVGGE